MSDNLIKTAIPGRKKQDWVEWIYLVSLIISFSGIVKFGVRDCIPFNSDASIDVRREYIRDTAFEA